MLITIHTVDDVADMLHKSKYGTWSKDYEACRALASYMDNLGDSDDPTTVDIKDWVVRFDIFKNVDDYNNQASAHSVNNLEDLSAKTTVIPLSGGRFIAESF